MVDIPEDIHMDEPVDSFDKLYDAYVKVDQEAEQEPQPVQEEEEDPDAPFFQQSLDCEVSFV